MIAINQLKKHFASQGFFANVSILVIGTVISHLITLVAYPLLALLYSPDQIGLFGLLINFVLLFGNLITLRYELAIVIEETKEGAVSILHLIGFLTLVFCLLVTLGSLFFSEWLARLIGDIRLTSYLWTTPIFLFLTGLQLGSNYYLTRIKDFTTQTASKCVQTASIVSIQIGSKLLLAAGPGGLIIGDLLGRLFGSLILFYRVIKDTGSMIKTISLSQIKESSIKHKEFPIYVVPYGLASSVGMRVRIILLASLASTSAVGLYDFALRLLYSPLSLISNSFKQVFFEKFAHEKDSSSFQNFVQNAIILLIDLTIPAFIGLMFYIDFLTSLIFVNPEWDDLGTYAFWVCFPAMFLVITAWLDRVYTVLGRQKLAFLLELAFSISITIIFAIVLYFFDTLIAIAALSIGTAIYNLIWFVITLGIAGFSNKLIFEVYKRMLFVGGGGLIVVWGGNLLFAETPALIVFILLLLIYYIFQLKKFISFQNGLKQIP